MIYLKILLLLAAGLLAACASTHPLPDSHTPWQRADVRLLADPSGRAFTAVYTRLTGAGREARDREMRVDLLRPATTGSRVLLALDSQPGGAALSFAPHLGARWEYLIEAPFGGLPRITGLTAPLPDGLRARVLRDIPDSLILRLSHTLLPIAPNASMIVFFQEPDAHGFSPSLPVDTLGPVRLDAPPPPPALLLLAFWDSLPSATPAQALRRWDGAHTGPYGQRHGLRVVLEAAGRSGVPLALLDLNHSARLAALEALGGLAQVRALNDAGLVFMAGSTAPGWEQETIRRFGLTAGRLWFGPPAPDVAPAQAAFARLDNPGPLLQNSMGKMIPLPGLASDTPILPTLEVNERGLSPWARAALLQVALSPDPGDLLALGGALPTSPWGDSLIAGPAFEYIAAHPWIQALDEETLLELPTQPGQPRCPDLLCLPPIPPETLARQQSLRSAIETAPDTLFTRLAWQTYTALTGPADDPRLTTLRTAYLGDIAYLLQAADWASAPREISQCQQDLDGDGGIECVLASKNFFLILATRGGRMVLAAAQSPAGPLQLVGPRSQQATGLGDPRDWKLNQGLASDPQEIPGGFADEPDPFLSYTPEITEGQVLLQQPETGLQKRFTIHAQGIDIHIESPQTIRTRLPILLMDNAAYQPGWLARYQANSPDGSSTTASWTWQLQDGACISLSTAEARFTPTSFIESRALIRQSEDPNLAHPTGHFFPFPLAVVEIEAQNSLSLRMKITNARCE